MMNPKIHSVGIRIPGLEHFKKLLFRLDVPIGIDNVMDEPSHFDKPAVSQKVDIKYIVIRTCFGIS